MYVSLRAIVAVCMVVACWQAQGTVFAATGQIKEAVDESIQIRQDIQVKEEQWRAEKEKLISHLEVLEHQEQQLKERSRVLQEKVEATQKRISAKQQQFDDMEAIRISIAPLIDSLISDLQAEVDGDLPFLAEERHNRLQRLQELRDDPEVSVSEKYRKVLEAMLVETEYGSTIEVYQQSIPLDGHDTLVDIFRLGRISLFFQTLDQKTCGYFNVATKSWQLLAQDYSRAIRTAMEIGAKRRPVELLTLPLGRIQPQ